MKKFKAALGAVVRSPAVQKEAIVLFRIAATVVAARYGLKIKF